MIMKNNQFLSLSLLLLVFSIVNVNAMHPIYIDGSSLTPRNESQRPYEPSWGQDKQGLWILYDSNGNILKRLNKTESKKRDKDLGIKYQYHKK